MDGEGELVENNCLQDLNYGMFDAFSAHILPCLRYPHLLSAELVCKRWREACSSCKVRKTGTCLVMCTNILSTGSPITRRLGHIYDRDEILQIHNPLHTRWLPKRVPAWPAVGPWDVYELLEAGNNGLLVLWRGELVSGSNRFHRYRHRIQVLNPLSPQTRKSLPVWEENDSQLKLLKMVQSEDDPNTAQEYSVLLFIGIETPRLVIFRSTWGGWRTCNSWPPLVNPREDDIVSIRKCCSGGRLYCLFRGKDSIGAGGASLEIWRFDLEAQEWTFIDDVSCESLDIEGQFLSMTLAGCGDRIFLVVTGSERKLVADLLAPCAAIVGTLTGRMWISDMFHRRGIATITSSQRVEIMDRFGAPWALGPTEKVYKTDSDGRPINNLVRVFELFGHTSSTHHQQPRWERMSDMPPELLGSMRTTRRCHPRFYKDLTIMDADERAIYFSRDEYFPSQTIVMFDHIHQIWELLEEIPTKGMPAWSYVEVLTFKPNKDVQP